MKTSKDIEKLEITPVNLSVNGIAEKKRNIHRLEYATSPRASVQATEWASINPLDEINLDAPIPYSHR